MGEQIPAVQGLLFKRCNPVKKYLLVIKEFVTGVKLTVKIDVSTKIV
jgi:hypothetical protein